ncbi:hypothetical protein [Agrobacterium tumefaciens]|uniref:hypothetical protein n=1 Tax=Agrobacterium tumefaciens TaxID=358 RepID=UPI0015735AC1|nr:hypothetical protein [Agrobacterium tumefaciens]
MTTPRPKYRRIVLSLKGKPHDWIASLPLKRGADLFAAAEQGEADEIEMRIHQNGYLIFSISPSERAALRSPETRGDTARKIAKYLERH